MWFPGLGYPLFALRPRLQRFRRGGCGRGDWNTLEKMAKPEAQAFSWLKTWAILY
jgi:hypothetical protein